MKKLLWPGIAFALIGSIVALHGVTLVYSMAVSPVRPPPPPDSVDRPRAGWRVTLGAEPGGLAVVELADAGGRPLAGAEVSVVARPAGGATRLADAGAGRHTGRVAGIRSGDAARVAVRWGGGLYTFDRIAVAPGGAGVAP